MKRTLLIVLMLFALCCVEGKKLSRGRGSSRKTNYNPKPTSISQPSLTQAGQPAAPKPSLFGWQEKPAQRKSSPPRQNPHPQPKQQPNQPQTHSYPSSNTGLSGSGTGKQSYPSSNTGLSGNSPSKQQESVQKSATQTQTASKPISQSNNQQSHSYPSSNNGLSGSGSAGGSGYPQQQTGLSGAGAPPAYSAAGGSNYHPQGPPPAYSNSGGYPKQGAGAPPPYNGGNYGNNHQHPAPPPPYSPNYGGGYGGGYSGGHGGYGYNNAPQMPGYFGNYGNNNGRGVGRSSNILTGVGLAGAGVGTVLTGLALWNLARSTGHHHHTVIYDNRGQPVAVAPTNDTEPVTDPILGDLVNCSLTISNDNATEVLAIPCAIATSFTPDADLKDANIPNNPNDNTKCSITVVTKAGREFVTTIPCSILLKSAAENNVTEPPVINNNSSIINGTIPLANENMGGTFPILNGSVGSSEGNLNGPMSIVPVVLPTAMPLAAETSTPNVSCIPEPGEVRDPINPCYAVTSDLSVIPLQVNLTSTTPPTA